MRQKSILFILADCLRNDMVYGTRRRPPTPTIDGLRARGTYFSQMISSTSMTSQNLSTFFTGCYPFTTGVRALRGDMLNPALPTLAEILRAKGYQTVALTTGPLWEGLGIERGFEQFDHRKPSPGLIGKRAEQIRAIATNASDTRPWFIYAHFYDIHTPRVIAPELNRSEYGVSQYERAVATFDFRLREILGPIDPDNTIIIFHADHGEIFPDTPFMDWWEDVWQKYIFGSKPWLMRLGIKKDPTVRVWTRWRHATGTGHGAQIWEGLVRVPLIIAGGGVLPAGCIVPAQVRQIDIMPTILDLVGIAPPAGIPGASLVPVVDGTDTRVRPAYMEAHSFGRDPNYYIRGIRIPGWKYIDSPTNYARRQLYALDADPREKHNLIQERPQMVARLEKMLEQEIKQVTISSQEDWTEQEEQLIEERLRNLGYF